MNPLPEPMLASFDWEKLLPLVFFALYGLAQLIGSMKKGKQQQEEQPETDVAERARQVREEIRRKIAERRRAAEGQGGQPATRPYHYDPTQPDGQKPLFHPAPKPHQDPARMQREQPRRRETRREEPAWSGDSGSRMSSLEKRLEEQRKILEQSRRQQREAREKARSMERNAGVRDITAGEVGTDEIGSSGSSVREHPETIRNRRIRHNILSDLSHPDGLKKAVLYREIIGPPLGLR